MQQGLFCRVNSEQKFKYAGVTVITVNTILFWKIPDLYIHTQPKNKSVLQLGLQILELLLFHYGKTHILTYKQ